MSETSVSNEVAAEKSSENTEKKLSEDAFQNFIQGKRHMLVQDYAEAVASLADACQLYAEHFGETALECAEVYFHYGKALFRLFQQQAGIIGNLMSDESSNEEDQKDSESEEDKEQENAENTDTTSNDEPAEENMEENDEEDLNDEEDASREASQDATVPSSSVTSEEKKDAKVVEEKSAEVVSASGDAKPEDTKQIVTDPELEKPGPSGSNPKTEEDVTDLQLAWENLEMAKAIFKNKEGEKNKEGQLKVAEILLILAEISMELENYSAAVADLEECLEIRREYLESDDRLIAETFYQFGLVYTLSSHVSLALENYQRSIDCIKLRIENLRGQTEVLKTPEGWDILPAEEIKELEAILPDIIGKMEDTKDMVQDTKDLLRKELSNSIQEVSPETSLPDKPVTNITHLLKRKKPEDQAECSSSTKKIKLTPTVVNGDEQAQPGSSAAILALEELSNT